MIKKLLICSVLYFSHTLTQRKNCTLKLIINYLIIGEYRQKMFEKY